MTLKELGVYVMKKLKNSRGWSLVAVTIIYIIATIIGVWSYGVLPYNFAINLFIADTIATVSVFIFSLLFSNASVYDPYWSVQPIIISLGFSLKNDLNIVKVLFLFTVILWGIRLTANGHTHSMD